MNCNHEPRLARTLVPHGHFPIDCDCSLSSIPLILGSTGKVQRNFIHPGDNVLELTDFFFTLPARLELNNFFIHCSCVKWLVKVIRQCHFYLCLHSHIQ